MTPLLEQFLSEARDFLQSIGERLLQLEATPGDSALIDELFRLVHTLKGNSGLFDLPELTRVLHAAEDRCRERRRPAAERQSACRPGGAARRTTARPDG